MDNKPIREKILDAVASPYIAIPVSTFVGLTAGYNFASGYVLEGAMATVSSLSFGATPLWYNKLKKMSETQPPSHQEPSSP